MEQQQLDINAIFNQFFGDQFPRHPEDIYLQVTVSPEEAQAGCVRQLRYDVRKCCGGCGGSGEAAPGAATPCPKCKGEGELLAKQSTMFGTVQIRRMCKKCKGMGRLIKRKNACARCGGKGTDRVEEQREYITLPAGCGWQRFSYPGKGHFADQDKRGTLFVTVSVAG